MSELYTNFTSSLIPEACTPKPHYSFSIECFGDFYFFLIFCSEKTQSSLAVFGLHKQGQKPWNTKQTQIANIFKSHSEGDEWAVENIY